MSPLTAPNSRPMARAAVAALFCMVGTAQWAPAAGPGVHGRVLVRDEGDTGIRAVAGAAVEFKDQAGKVAARATTDADGYYKVDLVAGTYSYTVRAPGYRDEDVGRGIRLQLSEGYAVYNFMLVKGTNDPNRKPPELPTVALGRLQGQVYEKTENGELVGINGATVTLRQSSGTQVAVVQTRPPTEPVKDPSGFAIALEAGPWKASVSAAGFETLVDPEPITIIADKMVIRDFELKRTPPPVVKDQGIKGVITVEGPRSPGDLLPKVKVTVRSLDPIPPLPDRNKKDGSPSPSGVRELRPSPEGAYRVELPAGRYEVTAEADGFVPARSGPAVVVSGAYTVVDLKLVPRPTELLVRVFDAQDKKPLAGVSVLVRLTDDARRPQRYVTDSSGSALHKASGGGAFQVLAQMEGYQPQGEQVKVTAGVPSRLDLYLRKDRPRIDLTLLVLEQEKRQPVPGARVKVSQPQGFGQDGVTGPKGVYETALPAEGTFTVAVSHPDYELSRQDYALVRGNNQRTIILTRKTPATRLILHVVEAGKKGVVPGAKVIVDPGRRPAAEGTTDAKGVFTAQLPGPGTYLVSVSHPDYEQKKEEFTLAAGDNQKTVVLTRPPARRTMNVLVREAGRKNTVPIEGAEVEVLNQKGKVVASGKTNRLGRFKVDLEAGVYKVTAAKDGFKQEEAVSSDLTKGDDQPEVPLAHSKPAPRSPEGTTPRAPDPRGQRPGAGDRGSSNVPRPGGPVPDPKNPDPQDRKPSGVPKPDRQRLVPVDPGPGGQRPTPQGSGVFPRLGSRGMPPDIR